MPGFGYGAQMFNDLWGATRTVFAKKTVDTLSRSHPLMDKISRNGNFGAKEGAVGKRNVELILARVNDNIRWIDFNEKITRTEKSLLEQIEWDWKFCYQDFILNNKVLAINKSDEIADLLEINQRALLEGFKRGFAAQIYSGGANSLTMGGLQYLLSANPYAANLTVLNLQRGGTPGDKYEFWRNRAGEWLNSEWTAFTDDSAKAEAMVNAWQHMLQVINAKDDTVDGIYCNYYFYNLYLRYMQDKLRINNVSSEKKDAGFASVEFMGVPVYLDKYCPESQIYFINSNYLHFKYLEGENFVQEKREIPDQFATQYLTTFIGNFIIEKPRAQGVITLLPSTVSAHLLPDSCNICKFSTYHDYDYAVTPVAQSSDASIEHTDYTGSGVYRKAYNPTPGPASINNEEEESVSKRKK